MPTTTTDDLAVRGVAESIEKAWADNDADAFADLFAPEATLIGDAFMDGQDTIRAFMTAGFAGPYRGTRVLVRPISVRFPTDDLALLITQGSVVLPGATEPAEGQDFLATSTVVRRAGRWLILAYQNSKVTSGG